MISLNLLNLEAQTSRPETVNLLNPSTLNSPAYICIYVYNIVLIQYDALVTRTLSSCGHGCFGHSHALVPRTLSSCGQGCSGHSHTLVPLEKRFSRSDSWRFHQKHPGAVDQSLRAGLSCRNATCLRVSSQFCKPSGQHGFEILTQQLAAPKPQPQREMGACSNSWVRFGTLNETKYACHAKDPTTS